MGKRPFVEPRLRRAQSVLLLYSPPKEYFFAIQEPFYEAKKVVYESLEETISCILGAGI